MRIVIVMRIVIAMRVIVIAMSKCFRERVVSLLHSIGRRWTLHSILQCCLRNNKLVQAKPLKEFTKKPSTNLGLSETRLF